jgi:predicted DNA-binding transcriptional regulator AlpA
VQPTTNPSRKILTVREAAAYLGVSVSWLNKQRLVGGFVPYVKIGVRRVGYDVADLDAATEKAKRRSTSETIPSDDDTTPSH